MPLSARAAISSEAASLRVVLPHVGLQALGALEPPKWTEGTEYPTSLPLRMACIEEALHFFPQGSKNPQQDILFHVGIIVCAGVIHSVFNGREMSAMLDENF